MLITSVNILICTSFIYVRFVCLFVVFDMLGVPVNTKHLFKICTMLDQRQRRWADVAQML